MAINVFHSHIYLYWDISHYVVHMMTASPDVEVKPDGGLGV
jgi:hypothetical protein